MMPSHENYSINLSSKELAEKTQKNLLEQYDAIEDFFCGWKESGKQFHLCEATLKKLNFLAMKEIRRDAGKYRDYGLIIQNSAHKPPNYRDVPRYMKELCTYVNGNSEKDPFHISAYIMWFLNWIHPFGDGNGRTARAASYLALAIGLDLFMTGEDIIPAQIEQDRSHYYNALDSADDAYNKGSINVCELEELLKQMLRRQLSPP